MDRDNFSFKEWRILKNVYKGISPENNSSDEVKRLDKLGFIHNKYSNSNNLNNWLGLKGEYQFEYKITELGIQKLRFTRKDLIRTYLPIVISVIALIFSISSFIYANNLNNAKKQNTNETIETTIGTQNKNFS